MPSKKKKSSRKGQATSEPEEMVPIVISAEEAGNLGQMMVNAATGERNYHCQQCSKVMDASQGYQCSRCKHMNYCSKECQVKHWSSHKSNCVPAIKREAMQPNGFSIAELQEWCAIHDYALGEAPVHALGIFDEPFSKLPAEDFLYLVLLKLRPNHDGERDPAKMFQFVASNPLPIDMVESISP
ncbi:hypothetical protein DL93DRAFT_2159864 [Clavulina sp. PMI_390]|nr:hypothetical protein DL93DRAFT_2159864 [Clavulina sp. PMI_390]